MATELEELLALHNRVLVHCWQSLGRLERPDMLNAHIRSLESAGRHLTRILEIHAEGLTPEVRREVMRTLARVNCFLRAVHAADARQLAS